MTRVTVAAKKGDERGQVERRGEGLQQLVVVLAVLVGLGLLLLPEDLREELLQERVHGGHAA